MVTASIIVLNYNGKPCIRETLTALKNQSYKDAEFILVDNHSTDDSPQIVKKEFPEVKFVMNVANNGICLGYNYGIKHAKGKYIATIANDMILDKDWLKNAIKTIENDNNLAVVGSFVEYDMGYYKGERVYGFYLDLMANPYPIHEKPAGYIFGPNGTLLKRSIVGETPYDTSGLYFFADDVYIGWKMLLTGHKSAPGEGVKMRHIGRVGGSTVNDLVEFHAEKDRFLSPLIFYGTQNLIKVFPLLMASIAFSTAHSLMKGRAHVRLKSYFWLLKSIGRILAERRNMQKQRTMPDKEIFKYITCKTPYDLGPLTPIVQKLLWLYCFILHIPVMDLQRKNEPAK